MAFPTIVDSNEVDQGDTLTKPTGLVDGDVLYIFWNAFGSGLWSGNLPQPPSGFTPIYNITAGDQSSYRPSVACFRKVITNAAGEPADYTVGTPVSGYGSSSYRGGIIYGVRGADLTTPEDDSGSTFQAGTGSDASTGANISTSQDDGLLFVVLTNEVTGTPGTPAGMTSDHAGDGGDSRCYSETLVAKLTAATRTSSGTSGGSWAIGFVSVKPAFFRTNLTSDAESGDLTTPAFTPPDGSLLVVVATAQDGGNPAFTAASNMGIDDSQNLTWTPFLDVDPPSGEVNYSPHIRCWYTEITTGVSMTVDIMGVSAAINGVVAAVMAWTGYDTADPIGATVTDNNVADDGADSMFLGAAPAASSEVIGALAHGINGFGTITAAHGSTFTELFDLMYIDNVGMSVESRIGSTSTTVDWTDTEVEGNGAYDTIALAFEIKAASAGAGSVDITGTPATVTVTAGSAIIGYLTRTNLTAKQTTTDGATSIQTDAFTPSDNSLLCVMATLQRQGAGSLPVANMAITDSVGLTWTPEVGAVGSLDWGPTTRIWTAPVTTGVSMTVTVSVTGGPVSHSQFIAVVDYVSYDTESSIGATASEPINDDGADSITLSSAPAITSEIFGGRAGGMQGSGSILAEPAVGHTELYDLNATGICGMQVQVRDPGSTSTAFSWADVANGTDTGYDLVGVAIEIKETTSVGSVDITGTPATVTVTAGSATIGVGNIFAEYFTGTDGANLGNGWVDDSGFGGPGIDIKYQSNRGSTLNNVGGHSGVKAHGLDVSGDWQIDFDCYASLVVSAGGVLVALLSNTTFEGWAVFVGNAVHIQRYNSGGTHDNLTNDDRPGSSGSSQSHITFTRRGSDGYMETYLDGNLLGWITDTSHDAGNTCMISVQDTNSPTTECWIDNLVISDVITGVGGGSVNLTGTPATVAVTAGSAVITATTAVTGTPATVTVTAGVADIVVAAPDPVLIAVRGVRNNNGTGDATVTVLNPTDIAVGNYLVARISVDNSGSSGARPGLNVTDSRSHTWTDPSGALQDPGSASSGIACYLAYVKVVTPFQAGDTFLFDWTTGTPRSAIVIEEWANIDQITPLAVAQVTAQNVSTTAQPAISRTPTAIGQLMYVAAALEGLSSYWGAQDSDTTGGSWGDLTKDEANSGTASTSVSVYGGYKVVTSTAAQTWNNTLGTTSDWAACAVVFAKQPVTTNITGTPAWVTVSTESAVVTGHADVVGTSASVAVQAGSGVLTADTAITGTPATVVVTAGVAQVGLPVDITGTSATVVVTAGSAVIGVQTNITGTSATVAIATGSAVIGVQTNITGTSAVVSVSAGVGTITGQADVIGTSAVVNIMAGSATIISGSDVIGIPATVYISAGTATITADTNIVGISAVVAITAGVGNIVGEANVTGTSATVTVTAGSAIVISGSDIIGIPATVYVVSSTGVITAQADIVGTTSLIAITAGVGQIDVITNIIAVSAIVSIIAGIAQISAEGSHIPPVPQGAIVIL